MDLYNFFAHFVYVYLYYRRSSSSSNSIHTEVIDDL